MNSRWRIWSAFTVLLVTCPDSGQASDYSWQVGFAKTAITPQEPVWLSGYALRTAPAKGKVHDLWAKAFVAEDRDKTRLILITLDLGSVNPEITSLVTTQVAHRFGTPPSHIVLNCSHTHCAPEVAAERRVFHGYPDDEEAKLAKYISQLEGKLCSVVATAIADLAPARLSVGRSSANFAFNRRDPSGIAINGVTDHEVPVLRVNGADGTLRGVLFGYACHNTTLDFQLYCGDYAGFAQSNLEDKFPGATAMFVNGCGGDQNPQPRHGLQQLEYAKQHGDKLAAAVETALSREMTEVNGPLKVAYGEAMLDLEEALGLDELHRWFDSDDPLRRRKAKFLIAEMEAGGKLPRSIKAPVHVASFGDKLLWIFLSGETVVDYSIRCKAEFAGPYVWVTGYCDDVFAYLPSRRVLLEGGYEGRDGIIHQLIPAPFLPSVEERMFDCIGHLVDECKKR